MRKVVAMGFGALFVLVTVSFAFQITSTRQPLLVNVFQLLSTPERYDRKTIAVVAFLDGRMGRWNLYPYELDATHAIPMNAIGVQEQAGTRKNFADCNGKYVRIVGTFRKLGADQLGSGYFSKVESIELWSDTAKPLSEKVRELHWE